MLPCGVDITVGSATGRAISLILTGDIINFVFVAAFRTLEDWITPEAREASHMSETTPPIRTNTVETSTSQRIDASVTLALFAQSLLTIRFQCSSRCIPCFERSKRPLLGITCTVLLAVVRKIDPLYPQ